MAMPNAHQSNGPKLRVAYQGEPGAYSQKATHQLLGPNVESLGKPSFEDVFLAVQDGDAEYAVLPVENSLGGSIHATYDLLLRYNLHIIGELDFRVEHTLMVLPGVKKSDIKKVISHPQALAQCDNYIRNLQGVNREATYDTAGSAKMIRDKNLRDTAAIASDLAAQHYGLDVVDWNIEDHDNNFTRFILLGKEPVSPVRNLEFKTSIVFSFGESNRVGILYKAISAFALRDIDLTKIESRPGRLKVNPKSDVEELESEDEATTAVSAKYDIDRPKYPYIFYLDCIASVNDQRLKNALAHLNEFSPFVRVLGSYPTRGALIGRVATAVSGMLRQPVSPRQTKRKLRIGIIGFGNFGQFLAKTLVKYADVYGTSRTDYSAVASELGCTFVPLFDLDKFFSYQLDVVILSVSILSFEDFVTKLPLQKLNNLLVVDVLSVKTHPKSILQKLLPRGSDILCTHPMYGPESGKHSWRGLPFVYERVRISREDVCNQFLSIFTSERCNMIELSCEDHDRLAAGTQFITHLTGRMLGQLNLQQTAIDTKGYESLHKLVDNTCKDSFDLFYGLFEYNPNSAEQIQRLRLSLNEVERQLRAMEKASGRGSPGSQYIPSPAIQAMKDSATVTIHAKTKMLEDQGEEVISLCVGEPDFFPPESVLEATRKAVTDGHIRYTGLTGTGEIRRAICQYLQLHKGVAYQENEIVVSNGGKQSVYQATVAIVHPGDEVIVPAPYWVSYPEIVKLAQGVPVVVDAKPEDGYVLQPETVAKAITPRTRLLILNNPSNPTGAVIPPATLEEIAAILRRPEYQHVYVLADEIYERMVYDTPHVSFASLAGMRERTVIVNGFSKSYAMTGYRLGYSAAPAPLAKAIAKLQGQITSSASSIAQKAGMHAISLDPSFLTPHIAEMRAKRDFTLQKLRAIPRVQCPVTEGAFYCFPVVSAYYGMQTPAGQVIEDSVALCSYLLEEYKTALVPGAAFGNDNCVRVSYATAKATLDEALTRLEACLRSLKANDRSPELQKVQ